MFARIRKLLTFILLLTAFLIILYSSQTIAPHTTTRTIAVEQQEDDENKIRKVEEVYRAALQEDNLKETVNRDVASSTDPDFGKINFFLLFIGYPRSGTTLIGSLLDAHKHIIIANEYNLLSKWKTFTSEQKTRHYIYSQLLNSSKSESRKRGQRSKEKTFFFSYHVPGLWQGRYKDYIKIIGDKKSTTTTRILASNNSYNRFVELMSTLNVPVKFMHLIRNPFDNIATMTLRSHSGLRMKAETEGLQVNDRQTLLRQTQIYFKLIHMNSKLRSQFGRNVLDIHYSSFIQQPKIWLKTTCDFLEVNCSEHYLNACVNVIFKNETYTRRHIVWPEDIKNMILKKIDELDFLNGLKFEIT